MSRSISLPTIQNWSCHSCGNCCREHQIVVTDAERQRILDQNWTPADGMPVGMKAFVPVRGHALGNYRLAHQPDGACVFLDQNNRCRIHARFGEAAKPLACRLYPFTFQPAGNGHVAVGLRFSCPSVAANQGAPLSGQRGDLQPLANLVLGEGDWPPPAISPGQQLDWPDTWRIVRRLREMVVQDAAATLALRLVHGTFIATMLGRATFDKVRGDRLDELLDALATAAPHETAATRDRVAEPSDLARSQFRLAVAQYASRDIVTAGGLAYRLRKMLAGLRMTRGRGETPPMPPSLRPVPFEDLEKPWGEPNPEVDHLFARYFDVKLMGLEFCGKACYGVGLAEGFQGLALLYPVGLYIARWLARSEARTTINLQDAQQALTIIDHNYGRSPLMGGSNFRRRMRWLSDHNEIASLAIWYSR